MLECEAERARAARDQAGGDREHQREEDAEHQTLKDALRDGGAPDVGVWVPTEDGHEVFRTDPAVDDIRRAAEQGTGQDAAHGDTRKGQRPWRISDVWNSGHEGGLVGKVS